MIATCFPASELDGKWFEELNEVQKRSAMDETFESDKAAMESDEEISELELRDDVLEKKMRKLEADAERLLHHSSQLLKELTKSSSKEEENRSDENPENQNSSA